MEIIHLTTTVLEIPVSVSSCCDGWILLVLAESSASWLVAEEREFLSSGSHRSALCKYVQCALGRLMNGRVSNNFPAVQF